MSYDELLSTIYKQLPQLEGKLGHARVVYVQEQSKIYVTFESMVLVEEATFMKMEGILRKMLPQRKLALRVISPGLREDFLANIGQYKQVLVDFLRRNYPFSASWVNQADWQCQNKRITLSLPDDFSLDYMSRQNAPMRLAQAVKDIFDAEVSVELTLAGDREKRMAEMMAAREQDANRAYTVSELRKQYGEDAAAVTKERAPRVSTPRAPKEPEKPRDPMVPQMTNTALGRAIMGRAIAEKPIEIKTLSA